jgi:2-polyprenyl-3-methyl-5-hydroxy-6-metoxy-1,4-benzoquinol methylase
MRRIIERFLEDVRRTAVSLEPGSIVDLGCGEGIVAGMLHESLPGARYLGIDLSSEAVETARSLQPDLEFRVGDVLSAPSVEDGAELVLCLEVVEHLDDPDAAVSRVLEWASGHALISVPWEPWFRLGNLLRGRHVSRLGNHPEHVQQFTPQTFSELLGRHAASHRVWTCFPWILGLARP